MYVYILKTESTPEHYYVGSTDDLKRRLEEHNSGKSTHTSKYKPWKMKTAIRFDTEEKALAFEKYLKTGSGRAFAKRHFCYIFQALIQSVINFLNVFFRNRVELILY